MLAVFLLTDLLAFLVDQKGGVKISDFGISKKVEDGKSTGKLYSASIATDIKKKSQQWANPCF
jgi:serine/threonine protein kinase